VAELSLKFDENDNRLKEFQHSNFNDLGKVLRSLYVFESRLRKEQQQIRRLRGERDSLIRQQQVEIAKLRQTLSHYCHKDDARDDVEMSVSKPDLITSISAQSHYETVKNNDANAADSERHTVLPLKLDGTRKNVLSVDTRNKKNPNNNINFNKNVYSKTVTDLSLNDISSFPNPTPNNNLFVVSNSIFSKNEFTYNEVSKEVSSLRRWCTSFATTITCCLLEIAFRAHASPLISRMNNQPECVGRARLREPPRRSRNTRRTGPGRIQTVDRFARRILLLPRRHGGNGSRVQRVSITFPTHGRQVYFTRATVARSVDIVIDIRTARPAVRRLF